MSSLIADISELVIYHEEIYKVHHAFDTLRKEANYPNLTAAEQMNVDADISKKITPVRQDTLNALGQELIRHRRNNATRTLLLGAKINRDHYKVFLKDRKEKGETDEGDGDEELDFTYLGL